MRLLIYSTTRLFSECLSAGLSRDARVESCDGHWDQSRVLDALDAGSHGALIVDLGSDGALRSCSAFHARRRDAVILGLAASEDPDAVVDCARAGRMGVVSFNASVRQTVDAVARALDGEFRCSPATAARLMTAIPSVEPPRALPTGLTRRETEVCTLICEGLTNKEIAQELFCSQGTVKNHVHNILSKLNLPRRAALSQVVYSARSRKRDVRDSQPAG